MSRVPSKNTGLEIAVRKLVWAMGYRYRLHARDLPGKPETVGTEAFVLVARDAFVLDLLDALLASEMAIVIVSPT